ncbi:MAG TPA: hypothetical protein VF905_11515 [Nitrospirota bacterium]
MGGRDPYVHGTIQHELLRRHCRVAQLSKRLGIFAPGGGFVFNQVHNVQANVPAENVIAMLEAAYEFGRYEEVSLPKIT